MLHHVHQPAANFVYLLFGDGQVVYSGFIGSCWAENCCLVRLETADESKISVSGNQNNVLKDAKTFHRTEGICRVGCVDAAKPATPFT